MNVWKKREQLILACVKKTDQTKQSSVGERRARWSARRQQAEVGLLYHAQEGGTHRVRQILQLRRPGIETEIKLQTEIELHI